MSLGCQVPIWVSIWHIEAYHPDLQSWMPLDQLAVFSQDLHVLQSQSVGSQGTSGKV